MANRSYLYAFDTIDNKNQYKDLSEWNWGIPISHKVLCSGDPKAVNTHIWEYDKTPIAVQCDYQKGLENFKLFLELLLQRDDITNKADLEKEIKEALSFFDDDRKTSQYFLLEAGEILDISGDLADAAEDLQSDVEVLSRQFDEYRSSKKVGSLISYFLDEAAKAWEENLGLYFTHVLYFHMGSWKKEN